MGIGAESRFFRYQFRAAAVGINNRNCRVFCSEFTLSLVVAGLGNPEPAPVSPANTISMVLPLASRHNGPHPAARVVVVRFTASRPSGLVTDRQSVAVLLPSRYEAYREGQAGQYRGLPIVVLQKIDGRPGILGGP